MRTKDDGDGDSEGHKAAEGRWGGLTTKGIMRSVHLTREIEKMGRKLAV